MPRKQKQYHFIYKTTNQLNGKYYIGMHSTNIIDDGYLGSGQRLWHAIRKYGRENFKREDLEFFPDRSSLREREKEIIDDDLIKDVLCMNLAIGGEGGFISKEAAAAGARGMNSRTWNDSDFVERNKKRMQQQSKILHQKGILKAPDWTGRHHREDTKKKIGEKNSLSQKGEKNSQFGIKWIHNLLLMQNKRIKKDDVVPDGWKLGRKMKF